MSEKPMTEGERIARKYVAHQITIAKFADEIDAAIAEALPRVDDAMVRKAFKRWYDASIWLGVYGGGYESLWQAWKAAIAALTTLRKREE